MNAVEALLSVGGRHQSRPGTGSMTALIDAWILQDLPAAFAHDDWLGPWAGLSEKGASVRLRTLLHASRMLRQHHHLAPVEAQTLRSQLWITWSDEDVRELAIDLACAMLGGWVRHGIEREEVHAQRQVMNAAQRERALHWSLALQVLPMPATPWPLPGLTPDALLTLGCSGLHAVLRARDPGLAQRWMLRCPEARLVPIMMSDGQCIEAESQVIERHLPDRPGRVWHRYTGASAAAIAPGSAQSGQLASIAI